MLGQCVCRLFDEAEFSCLRHASRKKTRCVKLQSCRPSGLFLVSTVACELLDPSFWKTLLMWVVWASRFFFSLLGGLRTNEVSISNCVKLTIPSGFPPNPKDEKKSHKVHPFWTSSMYTLAGNVCICFILPLHLVFWDQNGKKKKRGVAKKNLGKEKIGAKPRLCWRHSRPSSLPGSLAWGGSTSCMLLENQLVSHQKWDAHL